MLTTGYIKGNIEKDNRSLFNIFKP
jgi:hypothetical protein